jgi:hypothetical protein
VGQFLIRIWYALTAASRSFALGAVEAWGFWSTTLLLLGALIYLLEIAGGVTWRLIEGRLRPKLRYQEAAARLRQTILAMKAELYDSRRAQTKLEEDNAELARLLDAQQNWSHHWNADASRTSVRSKGA